MKEENERLKCRVAVLEEFRREAQCRLAEMSDRVNILRDALKLHGEEAAKILYNHENC